MASTRPSKPTAGRISGGVFGKYPELLKLVEHMSDEQIGKLRAAVTIP